MLVAMTPDDLERQFTLLTATARYDELRTREALAAPPEPDTTPVLAGTTPTTAGTTPTEAGTTPTTGGANTATADPPPLTREEALELLALGELIARKAGYGRQLTVRSARQAGASWSQIGAALGTSKQAAWEAHCRWIDDQAEQHRRRGYEGLADADVAAARTLAGPPDPADPGPR